MRLIAGGWKGKRWLCNLWLRHEIMKKKALIIVALQNREKHLPLDESASKFQFYRR